MSQGSFSPKIRFLGQKVCSVARTQTDRQTDTKVKTEDILSEVQEFSNFSSICPKVWQMVQEEELYFEKNASKRRFLLSPLVPTCL